MSRLVNSLGRLLGSPHVRRLGRWSQQPPIRLAIMGLIASFAFLLLVVFLAVNWYSIPDSGFSRSGVEIMLGLGDEDFEGEGGFGRGLDWLLVIIPLGSLALAGVAGLVFAKRLPYQYGVGSAMGVGLLLFVTPWVWQDLSSNAWRSDFEGDLLKALTDGYRIALPMVVGLLIMLLSGFGWITYYAHQLGFFVAISPATAPPSVIPEPEPKPSPEIEV